MNMSFKRFSKLAAALIISLSVVFPLTAKAATFPILSSGSSGVQVSLIQQKLKALGYFNYWRITGYYGAITQDAVTRFQNDKGLYTSGTVNDVTSGKIDQIINAIPASYYTAKSGDSLWLISRAYGTNVDMLKAMNNTIADTVYTGQILRVPGKAAPVLALTESSNPDLYWMARIIEAEASGEPYAGKVAVGNVIMNRVVSNLFPNTVKGVVFEFFDGIPQFSPVQDGTIYNTPSSDSIRAAQEAISGAKPVGNSTYFFNPAKSSATWIVNNKSYVTTIGNHVFYQ